MRAHRVEFGPDIQQNARKRDGAGAKNYAYRSKKMAQEQTNIFESMSSYELLELIYTASSSITELIAVFISILSAFFVAAYYFGNKLSGGELLLLSAVYSAFSLVTMLGIYAQISGLMAMQYYLSGADNP